MLVPAPTVAMEASGSATPEVSGSPTPRDLVLPATPESFGLAGISNSQYAHYSDPELLSIVDLAKKHPHFVKFYAEQAAEYIDGEWDGFGDVAGDPLADLESWDSWMAVKFEADHMEWVEMLRDSCWRFDNFGHFFLFLSRTSQSFSATCRRAKRSSSRSTSLRPASRHGSQSWRSARAAAEDAGSRTSRCLRCRGSTPRLCASQYPGRHHWACVCRWCRAAAAQGSRSARRVSCASWSSAVDF